MKKLKKHKTKDFYVVKDTYPEIILGSLVTLPGPSGGRTTLRMIAGFESPDEVEIYLGGEAINALTPSKREPPWYSGTLSRCHTTIFSTTWPTA